MVRQLLLVGMGGALGSMLRYGAALLVRTAGFPWATFLVNIAGSLLIGVFMGFFQEENSGHASWKLFLATGICGGFTTFSTFSVENLRLLQEGKWGLAGGYILLSLCLGIAATWLGFRLVQS